MTTVFFILCFVTLRLCLCSSFVRMGSYVQVLVHVRVQIVYACAHTSLYVRVRGCVLEKMQVCLCVLAHMHGYLYKATRQLQV